MTMDAATRLRLRKQAETSAESRDWPTAISLFNQLADADPGDADVLLQLSYMYSLAGEYRRAREYAVYANALKPTEAGVVRELIARLRTFNEGEALLACADRLGPLRNVAIPQLLAFAAQLSYLNLPERAIAMLDEARHADPDYPPTLLSRAQVLIYLGRFDEAQADLECCLKRAPGLPKLMSLLVTLGRMPKDGRFVQSMVDALQRQGISAEDTALLGFALHVELDRLGCHQQAWQALELGCRAKRATLQYNRSDTEMLISALIAGTNSVDEASATSGARIPIFITGMHRSGTTLLEQLLSGSPDVQGVGELYDFTSAMRYVTDHHCRGVIDRRLVELASAVDFAAVGERYLAGMEWRLGTERFFTDKLPSNFLHIGYIARALPQARILHMVRDPVETCFSNLRELFSDANPYSYDLGELAHFHGQYRRVMAHWHRVLPGRILDVPYDRLTREPEAVMREVSAFCGVTFDSSMVDTRSSRRGVATASAVQVRQGIQVRDVPKWAPYAKQLEPLVRALG